ncbi:hypothetical protein, partial [Streptomyces kaempferi]
NDAPALSDQSEITLSPTKLVRTGPTRMEMDGITVIPVRAEQIPDTQLPALLHEEWQGLPSDTASAQGSEQSGLGKAGRSTESVVSPMDRTALNKTPRGGETSASVPTRWDEETRHFVLDPRGIAHTPEETQKKQVAATASLLHAVSQQKADGSTVRVRLEPSYAVQTHMDTPDAVKFLSQVVAHRTAEHTTPLTITLSFSNGYTINLCTPQL